MKGKRVMKRRRNPLTAALGLVIAAEVLLGAGLLFLRPSGPGQRAPARAESIAAASGEQAESAGPEHAVPEREPENAAAAPAELSGEPQDQRRFVISLLGDCTLSSSHYTNHFESVVGDDLAYPFSNVADILTADDLTLANLECSFSDKRLESASQYAFCGQAKYAESLALGGVDCVSMANNHTNDFGSAGIADTAAALEQADVAGIQGNQGVCFDLRHDGGTALRVGVYVLPFNGSTDQMKKGAARLREDGADIVIACMHAGTEKIYVPTARQTYLARAAVSGGADIVVGTHPHVLQPAEEYQGGVILYSLGNFCFGGNRNPGDKDTVIAQVVVDVEETGVSWEMAYVPCRVSSVADTNDYRPTPYEQGTEGWQRCLRKLASPWDTTTAEEAAAKAAAAESGQAP
ncbi:MAG: CapA family protein [Oscillospiraceae bacterium]|nr:CapA family protein [Oscillospiraceae bacterium]